MPPDVTGRRPLQYLLAVFAVACALGLRWLFEPWLNGQLPFVTIFGAVALSVWVGGVGPAVLAAAIGFVAAGLWLFGEGAIRPGAAGFLIAAVGYSFSCGLIIVFGAMLRRTQRRLEVEVSQRRDAERGLGESEQHYRHTVELNPQVTWTALPDGRLDRVGDRWRTWTGSSGLGESWGQGLHPDDFEPSMAAWQRSIATGEPYDLEHRVRRLAGDYRWARSRAFPRHDDQGHIVKWYGTTEDIHERKQAESRLNQLNAGLEQEVATRTAALQAGEARLRTIFSTSLQYQGLLAPDGTLIDANATSLHGIDAALGDVVGKPYWETPWFAATPGLPELIRRGVLAAAAGQSFRQELMVNLPLGWRRFDFAMRPVTDAGAAVVAIVPEAVDVTERHLADERLRQSQKMEAVGQLTGGVAHDFNNLLQVISANLHLIAKQVAGNEQAKQRVANAQAAVKRGARLASQLLAFSRRQALEPKVVNVGRFVAGMEDMLTRSIGEAIEIEIVVSGGLWNCLVDPTQIENAVLNLAINARDAMRGSGKLTIEVGNAFLDDAYTRPVADLAPGQYVMLAVSDTGTGMPPEVVAQAFEPFFSTKPAGSGTGLGLSMVYGFVKQSGGHVKIYSEVGHGTTIKLYLPRVHQNEDVVRASDAGPVIGGTETVLVVEDDDGVRAATVEMLGELGYRVLQASSAAEALAVIEGGASVDLLFTDVVMPGTLRSPELARLARERLPALAVLFTSGYTQNAIVHGGRLDPGVELLAKPYTLDALAHRLRLLLPATAPRAATPPAPAPAAPPTVLLVEDDASVRSSTAGLVRDLGYTVAEAGSAEDAMAVLQVTPVDVLLIDVGLPGVSGDVFAAEARVVRPDVRIVFATGNPSILDGGEAGPVLLRKPYDSVGLAAALNASFA